MSGYGDPIGELRDKTNKFLDELTKKLDSENLRESRRERRSPRQLEEIIARQNAILERVMTSAVFLGHVVSLRGDQKTPEATVIISCHGQLLEVKPVPGLELKVGDSVRLAPNSSQIVGVIDNLEIGSICFIRRVIDENFSEVDFNGSIRRVLNGALVGKIESEDRVILDSSGSIVIARLDRAVTRFRLGSRPTIAWDDICGQDEAKRQLQEMIELPAQYPGLYQYYQLTKDPPKGALLYGPPGCGKTMLLEAVATSLAKFHGNQGIDSGFIMIKGPEVLDMYVGVAEKAIRQLFIMARKHKTKYGFPAVIVIDEAEALLSKRGSGKSADMEKTIVPTFLTEMQGIDDSGAIVFLSTNRPDVLDPAVIRDGRLSRQIKVTRPDKQVAQAIFALNFKMFPLAEEANELATYAASEFYSEHYPIYEVSRSNGQQFRFKLSDLINGAMVVGVVKKAVYQALQRDIANGGEKELAKRTRVSKEDTRRAVEETYREKFDLPHGEELKDFVTDFQDEVSGIKKLRLNQAPKD